MDERVMDFLGLVNKLLMSDPRTRGWVACRLSSFLRGADCFDRQFLPIRRYSITSLSAETGLLGWLHQCDTLYALIREYRLKHPEV